MRGELLYPDEPDRVLGSGAGRYTENYNLDSQKRVSRIDVDMTSAVSSPRKTCSLKREITYNDSDAEEGNKKYASELVKSIYVRDGKKDENEPALSVYTLEYDGDGKHHKAHVLKARNCNCARHGDELDIRVRQVEPSDARKQRKTGEDLDVQLRRGRQHNGKEGIRLHHG